MLANTSVAPFELIRRPDRDYDWVLIDHLMVIHKAREDDYVEDDVESSVERMARRFASWYTTEKSYGHAVVLVKDGRGVQKPGE